MPVFVHFFRDNEISSQEILQERYGRGSWDLSRGSGSIASGVFCYRFRDETSALRNAEILCGRNEGLRAVKVVPSGGMFRVGDVVPYVRAEDCGKDMTRHVAARLPGLKWASAGACRPLSKIVEDYKRHVGLEVSKQRIVSAVATCVKMYGERGWCPHPSTIVLAGLGFSGIEACEGANHGRMGSVIWNGKYESLGSLSVGRRVSPRRKVPVDRPLPCLCPASASR